MGNSKWRYSIFGRVQSGLTEGPPTKRLRLRSPDRGTESRLQTEVDRLKVEVGRLSTIIRENELAHELDDTTQNQIEAANRHGDTAKNHLADSTGDMSLLRRKPDEENAASTEESQGEKVCNIIDIRVVDSIHVRVEKTTVHVVQRPMLESPSDELETNNPGHKTTAPESLMNACMPGAVPPSGHARSNDAPTSGSADSQHLVEKSEATNTQTAEQVPGSAGKRLHIAPPHSKPVQYLSIYKKLPANAPADHAHVILTAWDTPYDNLSLSPQYCYLPDLLVSALLKHSRKALDAFLNVDVHQEFWFVYRMQLVSRQYSWSLCRRGTNVQVARHRGMPYPPPPKPFEPHDLTWSKSNIEHSFLASLEYTFIAADKPWTLYKTCSKWSLPEASQMRLNVHQDKKDDVFDPEDVLNRRQHFLFEYIKMHVFELDSCKAMEVHWGEKLMLDAEKDCVLGHSIGRGGQ